MIQGLANRIGTRLFGRPQRQRDGLLVLAAIVVLMWVVEAINSIDSNRLNGDGIVSRDVGRFWGVLTSPFIHASFQHLMDNTVPFVFLGVIIALHGAGRLLLVTGFIMAIGGLGTWVIGPGGTSTIGASGVVFGYATYLLTRGFFDRSIWELGVGIIVGVIWGAALLSSLVPHGGISWQAHLCGGIAGVIVAWRLSQVDNRRAGGTPAGKPGAHGQAGGDDQSGRHGVIDFADV
jgi:membrane associated rhomboid family serine protease